VTEVEQEEGEEQEETAETERETGTDDDDEEEAAPEGSSLSPEQLANIKAIRDAQEASAEWEAPDDTSAANLAHVEALQRWNKYLVKELKAEYGEDGFARLHMCPLCQYTETPGYVVLQRPPDEVVSVVRQILNVRDPSKLQKDRHSQRCVECNGDGIVSMDNHVAGQESLPCIGCKGRGWTPIDEKRQEGYVAAAPAPGAPNGSPAPAPAAPAGIVLPPEAEALTRLGYIVVPPATATA